MNVSTSGMDNLAVVVVPPKKFCIHSASDPGEGDNVQDYCQPAIEAFLGYAETTPLQVELLRFTGFSEFIAVILRIGIYPHLSKGRRGRETAARVDWIAIGTPCEIQLQARPMPTPAAGEVLVAVKSLGICGSDIEYWANGRLGPFIVNNPMIIGHECAGVVIETGSSVSGLRPGQRVALEPGVPCRLCDRCRSGHYNLCSDVVFWATPPVDGSLVRFLCHPADFCYPLPDGLSFEEGAMCEPLSVAVHACFTAKLKPGCRVLVLGCGPIGMLCMLASKTFGASNAVVVDIVPGKVRKAVELGHSGYVTGVVVSHTDDGNMISRRIAEMNLGVFDICFECTGVEACTSAALLCARTGGCVICVGLRHLNQKLPIMQAMIREVVIRGIFRYRNTWPICLKLLESGKVDVKGLVHPRRFSIEEALTAFELAKRGIDPVNGNPVYKVMFRI